MRLNVTPPSELCPHDEILVDFGDPQVSDLRRIGKGSHTERSEHRPSVCPDQLRSIEQEQIIDDAFP
jgi:hypothetical protein